jgi:hypothetical protein
VNSAGVGSARDDFREGMAVRCLDRYETTRCQYDKRVPPLRAARDVNSARVGSARDDRQRGVGGVPRGDGSQVLRPIRDNKVSV